MKNNVGWIVALCLVICSPARGEMYGCMDITPWDLYVAACLTRERTWIVDKGSLNNIVETANYIYARRPKR